MVMMMPRDFDGICPVCDAEMGKPIPQYNLMGEVGKSPQKIFVYVCPICGHRTVIEE